MPCGVRREGDRSTTKLSGFEHPTTETGSGALGHGPRGGGGSEGHVPELSPCSIDEDDYVRVSKTQKIYSLTHADAILHPILLPLDSPPRIY